MKKFIVIQWKGEFGREIIAISNSFNTSEYIKKRQKVRRDQNRNNRATWFVHEGDFISAMTAETK